MTTPIDIYGSAIPPRSDPRAFTAYAAAVMAAAEYGHGWSNVDSIRCYGTGDWGHATTPGWDWLTQLYRISPSSRPKKFVLWRGPDDVPKGPAVWLRRTDGSVQYAVIEIWPSYFHCGYITEIRFADLGRFQWSPDRIVWADCVVEVET